jgi:hypothetical protein
MRRLGDSPAVCEQPLPACLAFVSANAVCAVRVASFATGVDMTLWTPSTQHNCKARVPRLAQGSHRPLIYVTNIVLKARRRQDHDTVMLHCSFNSQRQELGTARLPDVNSHSSQMPRTNAPSHHGVPCCTVRGWCPRRPRGGSRKLRVSGRSHGSPSRAKLVGHWPGPSESPRRRQAGLSGPPPLSWVTSADWDRKAPPRGRGRPA